MLARSEYKERNLAALKRRTESVTGLFRNKILLKSPTNDQLFEGKQVLEKWKLFNGNIGMLQNMPK